MKHAISFFDQNAVYSYIPKNACSTLRFSAAVANGALSPDADVNWIHHNNRTFNPGLEFAARASYTFVVLRCPYRRLASAYLDKLIDAPSGPKRSLPISFSAKSLRSIAQARYYDDLTFHDFCKLVERQPLHRLNEHWRPQSSFLLYTEYDDYFCLEDFEKAQTEIQANGLKIHDTREALKHDSARFERKTGDFVKHTARDIREMKKGGTIPSYDALFDDASRAIVREKFADDMTLFDSKFPSDWKLFS